MENNVEKTNALSNHPVATVPPEPTKRSRTSAIWVASVLFVVIMVLLLIFMLQNSQTVEVSYFGLSGNISLAVAMLCSAIVGAGLLALAGGTRILQLRRMKSASK